MNIIYYHRRSTKIHYSLELLFDNIRKYLQKNIKSIVWISPWYSKGFFPRLKMLLNARKYQADINHITGDINFIALGLKKKKTILTIHDLGILNNTSNPIAKWILKTFWITLPVKCVNIVTVVSETTKQQLLNVTKISPNKVRVIGNFIKPAFHFTPKDFSSSNPNILHIGSAYNKNLERLTMALKDIKCHLTIIGYPTSIQLKLLKDNKISHTVLSGLSEDELIEQYQKCDLLTFVSLLEGFGLPILEAQATGRPVITSNLSSMPEVASEGACYVDPYDINSIKQGILKVINDKHYQKNIIEKGLQNVKRFSLKKVAQQYSDLYQELYENNQKIKSK